MTVLKQMDQFSDRFGKQVTVDGTPWHYCRVGTGAPILWLTGGLRRAALGFAFTERLAASHTVIAPDYPPVRTVDEFIDAFDVILRTEQIDAFALGGQSCGGFAPWRCAAWAAWGTPPHSSTRASNVELLERALD